MGKRHSILTPIKKAVFAFVVLTLIGIGNKASAEICTIIQSTPTTPLETTSTTSSDTTTDTTLIEQGKPSNPQANSQANSQGGEISTQHFCNQEPPPPSPSPPAAPFGLTYSISNNSTGTVSISWASNASATHYVEESKNSGTWVAAGAITLTSYVLSDRRDGTFNRIA